MGTPSNALQTAIYQRLTGYAPLRALVSDRIYDFVPPDAQAPFVRIGEDTEVDDSTKTNSGWDVTLTIHCWDFTKAGRKSIKAIMSAIYDALHRQEASIALAGFTLTEIRSEFATTFQDTSETGEADHFYHGVQRFRALIETTS